MKRTVKILFVFFLNFLMINCLTIHKIKEPENPMEKRDQGIVAFGIFYFDPTTKSFLSSSQGEVLPIHQVHLFVVNVVDDKKRMVSVGEFSQKDNQIQKVGMKRIVSSNMMQSAPWYVFRSWNPKVKYAIRDISYTIKCGDACGQEMNLRFPAYFSQKSLTFSSPAGKVHFAGIFQLKKVILKEGGFLHLNEESGYVMEDGLDVILALNELDLNKLYFGEEEHSRKGAEIKFLKDFIQIQGSGHWVEKAKEQLAELEKGVENKDRKIK